MNPVFGQLQARLQARHGGRPDAAEWRRLEAVPGYDLYLKQAREGSLAAWLPTIGERDGAGDLDRLLRDVFLNHVQEVCGWVPAAWRPAVSWCDRLIDLPLRQAALEGASPPGGWTPNPEPVLDRAWRRGVPLLEAWVNQWRRLWPKGDGFQPRSLEGLIRLLQDHLTAFADLPDAKAAREARSRLRERLIFLFRRQGRRPPAVFIHLLLAALDLERLRGGLLQRALFSGSGSGDGDGEGSS